MRSVPRCARTPVWAPPISLAATFGITVVFSSSAYLDVSVQRVPSAWLWIRHAVPTVFIGGFPHSDIHGSKDMCSSPWLFAACHVLLRLQVPKASALRPFCLTALKVYSVILLSFLTFLSRFLTSFVFLYPSSSLLHVSFTFLDVFDVFQMKTRLGMRFSRIKYLEAWLPTEHQGFEPSCDQLMFHICKHPKDVIIFIKRSGSHLLSHSLSPQYPRPDRSLPSCSGWVRVFPLSASPPDLFILLLSTSQISNH